MEYTVKKLPNAIREVKASFTYEEFKEYWDSAHDEALAKVNLKGFRPGTAPKELADKAIDKEGVFHEAATHAIRHALKQINEENNWDFIDQPQIEILDDKDAKPGLKFKAILTVFPDIKLGNYKKISKEVFSEKKEIKIEEDEITKALEWIQKSRAQLVRSVQPAQKGDVVSVFCDGKEDKFVLGESHLGIDDKIIGRKEGEKFDGIELKEVFERKIPELNEEFVKGLGHFHTVEDLKNSVREGLIKEKKDREAERNRAKILEELVKSSDIEMPQALVEKTYENMLADYQHFFNKKPEKEDEIKKELKEQAKNRVASSLVINQIAKELNLEPNPEEVEAEANHILKSMHRKEAERTDPQKIYDYSYDIIKNRKVFEYLESIK